MKFLSAIALIAGALIFAGNASGQQLDNPTTVSLGWRLNGYTNYVECESDEEGDFECDELRLDADILDGSTLISSADTHGDEDPGWIYGTKEFATLALGKDYTIDVDPINNVDDWDVLFDPPSGFDVYVNGSHSRRFSGGSWGRVATIRVEHSLGVHSGLAGTMNSLAPGKILFSVSLGFSSKGEQIGNLGVARSDFSSEVFTPNSLQYGLDDPNASVYQDSSGNFKQIVTETHVFDVEVINSESYYLDIHEIGDLGSHNGHYYSVNGTPEIRYWIGKDGSSTKLKIVKTIGSNSWHTKIHKTGSDWKVYDWHKVGTSAPRVIDSDYTSSTTEIREVESQSGAVASKTLMTFQDFGWGKELKETRKGYGTENLVTTYNYHTTSWLKGSYGKLKSETRPDGSWIKFEYYENGDAEGEISEIHEPWMDSPSSIPSDSSTSGKITEFNYTTAGGEVLPSLVETRVNGTRISKISSSYSEETVNVSKSGVSEDLDLLVAIKKSYSSSSDYLTTVRKSFTKENGYLYKNRPYSEERADGTIVSYAYFKGTYNDTDMSFSYSPTGMDYMEIAIEGSNDSSVGSQYYTDEWGSSSMTQDIEPLYIVPHRSTLSKLIRKGDGSKQIAAIYLHDGSDFVMTSAEVSGFDDMGRLVDVTRRHLSSNSGTSYSSIPAYEAVYIDGLLEYEIDELGVRTDFDYDDAMRIKKKVVAGAASYDGIAAVPAVESHYTYDAQGNLLTSKVGASSQIESSMIYDKAGRLTSSSVSGPSGNLMTSYSYSASTRTRTVTHPGGGTSIETKYRDGRVKSVSGTAQAPRYFSYSTIAGGNTETYSRATSSSTDLWSKTRYDWLGRVYEVETPTQQSSSLKTLVKREYNSSGQLFKVSTEDSSGSSLMADSLYYYDRMGALEKEGLDVNGNGSLNESSMDRIALYKRDTYTVGSALYRQHTVETYPYDNSSSKITLSKTRTRLTGLDDGVQAGKFITSIEKYDVNNNLTRSISKQSRSDKILISETDVPSASNDIVTEWLNGVLVRTTSESGAVEKLEYDAWGRLKKSDGRDSVDTNFHYVSGTGFLDYTQGPNGRTEFGYDAAGRRSVVSEIIDFDSDDEIRLDTRFAYNAMGLVTRKWGNNQTPVENFYDEHGIRYAMRTFRNGSGWGNASWPTNTGTPSDTDWTIHGPTGLVTAKSDDSVESALFTYDSLGRLKTRTWARGVSTTYSYSPDTGELTGKTYSDSTPNVSFSYHRHGGYDSITDATGTRDFTYRSDLQVEKVILPYGTFGGTQSDPASYGYSYQSSGVAGRVNGFLFGRKYDLDEKYRSTYGFDSATGRISYASLDGRQFDYTYQPNSDLVQKVKKGTTFERVTSWDLTGNRELSVETKWNSTTKAKFSYGYDDIGRRTYEKRQGDLLDNPVKYPYGTIAEYEYGDGGRLTDEDTYDLYSSGSPNYSTGMSSEVEITYDNAGNRVNLETETPSTTDYRDDYTPNGNNEYDQILEHTFYSSGSSFRTYDLESDKDGNLTFSGRQSGSSHIYEKNFEYDAENRLVKYEIQWNRRYTFTYDYMGRMSKVDVEEWENDDDYWDFQHSIVYVYDGWNLAYWARGNYVKSFLWGLDKTGSVHGAGGVGGHLMERTGNSPSVYSYKYTIVDGRGNVAGSVDESGNGTGYAHSAYGGYNSYASMFGFASKFTFGSLTYYNNRFYDRDLGRFINRDPIGELGGENLYAYVGNDPVNKWDILGFTENGGPSLDETPQPIGDPGFTIEEGGSFTQSDGTVVTVGPGTFVGFGGGPSLQSQLGYASNLLQSGRYSLSVNGQPVVKNFWNDFGELHRRSAGNRYHRGGPSRGRMLPRAASSGGGFGWRDAASIGVGAIPVVGTVQSVAELISGRDYITGERTSRILAGVGIVAGLIPFGKAAVKGGSKIFGKWFGKAPNNAPTPGPRLPDGSFNSSGGGLWKNADGSIRWPSNDGFAGTPSPTTLKPGTRIDRYGYPGGSYVSPEGVPYPQRALAPGTDAKPYNVYEVLKPIDAQGGKIAPWFGQPGGGTQFKLNQSVQDLIDGGYIRQVN